MPTGNNTENVTTKFKVDISDLKQNIAEANKQIKLANAQFKNATAGMDDWSESADGLSAKIEQQNAIVAAEEKKLEALKEQLQRLNAAQEKGESIIADLTEKQRRAAQQYGENSDEAKAYAKQLLDAQKAQQRNADAAEKLKVQIINQDTAVKNATAQTNKYQTALTNARTSEQALTQKVERQQTELRELKSRYADTAATVGRNSDEAKELARQIADLSGELKQNRDAMNDAETAADQLDVSLEDTGGAVGDLESGFTVAKGAIANFIADSINALLSKLGEAIQYLGTFGNEFDEAMNSFQASTGASAAEMAEFEESVKRIYNSNYGDSFEDIAAAMATVKQQAGDIGADELEKMTTRAIMLRDTFDFDVNESIRTVEMMMQQFGVTSDEAFNLLAQGAQAGLDKNGDLLDTINEYAVQYKQQGYSAEEFFNSLKNGTDAGTFSVDKLGDAMKEFGIRAKDNSDSTRQAFADLGIAIDNDSDAIGKAGDSVEDYREKIAKLEKNIKYAQIQQAGFTEKTSDLTKIKTADNIAEWTNELSRYKNELSIAEQNLADMQNAANSGAMSIDDLSAKFAAGGEEARDATNQVMTALFNMDDQVKQNEIGVALFGTMWEDLGADGVKALLDVNGEISNTTDALGEIDKVKYDSVGNAIEGIKRNLETGILMPISEKILPKVQELSDKFSDWLNDPQTQAKIQEFSDKFADFAENGIDKVITAFEWIIDHKDGIMAAIAGIATAFVAFKAVTMVQAVVSAFQALAAVIELVGAKQAITNAIMAANPIGLIVAAIAGLIAAFAYLWKNNEEFREFWINLWEKIKDVCGAAWETIKEFFSTAWEFIKRVWDAVEPYFSMMWDNIKAIFSAVKSVLSGDFSSAWDAVKQIFANVGAFFGYVWSAIKGIFANVGEFFGNIFSAAWDKIKGVWGVVSGWFNDHVITPIKNFFAPIAEWFSQLFESIWATVKSVFEVIGQLAAGCVELVKVVWGAVSDWFSENVVNPVKNFFSGLWNGIKTAASAAWEFIKTVWGIASGWFNENIIQPISKFFSALWGGIKSAASTALEFIKNVWAAVSGWFDTTIIQPVSKFFSGMWDVIRTAAQTAWNGIKTIWGIVSGWFVNTIINPVKNAFASMWDKLKNGAKSAWEGIKSVFSTVSDWFRDKFSDAWQKVKDVFSTGGKVFDGIKDGIVSAFKTVVNAIIRGINKVVAIPFDSINGILDKLKAVSVAGVEPFKNLITRLPVPQIPELAQGGIVNRRTLATIGEDGTEAVIPLQKNKAGLKQIAQLLAREIKGGGTFDGNGDQGGKGGDTIYNFNQTNNSPKSLSRYEIYRQTKNLINVIKVQGG